MRFYHVLSIIGVVVLAGAGCTRETINAEQVLAQADAAYQSMDTYQSQGKIISEINAGGKEMTTDTTFTVLLKKPNLYLVTWSQKIPGMPDVQTGAVWHDGARRYLYMSGVKAYCPMPDDASALGAATGISNGAAATVPFSFLTLPDMGEDSFSRLNNPEVQGSEDIGGEACYIVRGPSPISKEERFWISKESGLMRQCSRSLEAPDTGRKMPEMNNAQIEETLKAMGQEVTEENKSKYRKMMESMSKMSMRGTVTEIHESITSPDVAPEDFRFMFPEGTTLMPSFDAMLASARKTRESQQRNIPPKKDEAPALEQSDDAGEVLPEPAQTGEEESNTSVLSVS